MRNLLANAKFLKVRLPLMIVTICNTPSLLILGFPENENHIQKTGRFRIQTLNLQLLHHGESTQHLNQSDRTAVAYVVVYVICDSKKKT